MSYLNILKVAVSTNILIFTPCLIGCSKSDNAELTENSEISGEKTQITYGISEEVDSEGIITVHGSNAKVIPARNGDEFPELDKNDLQRIEEDNSPAGAAEWDPANDRLEVISQGKKGK